MNDLKNIRTAAGQSISRKIEKSGNARKGFTVLELLVASLLLGMLMTILTMIFNQSSIAWRTGVANVSNLSDARETISDVRYKADNVYMWKGEKFIHGVFTDEGDLQTSREGYIDSNFGKTDNSGLSVSTGENPTDSYKSGLSCGGQGNNASQGKSYVVNVMSYGPDLKKDTRYDNVYSISPADDPSEW